MSEHGYRPASHPVLRAKQAGLLQMVQRDPVAARAIVSEVIDRTHELTESLELIARIVAKLPDQDFTVEQRKMGMTIAAQLHSLSREPEARDHERFYRAAQHQEVEERYAAIADAARDPQRRIADIAKEFDVSKSLVSRIAIARGARRRTRHDR